MSTVVYVYRSRMTITSSSSMGREWMIQSGFMPSSVQPITGLLTEQDVHRLVMRPINHTLDCSQTSNQVEASFMVCNPKGTAGSNQERLKSYDLWRNLIGVGWSYFGSITWTKVMYWSLFFSYCSAFDSASRCSSKGKSLLKIIMISNLDISGL